MSRDERIKNIFEVADDGMQGVLGYYYYVKACQETSERDEVINNLPSFPMRITHQWGRFYDARELCQAMEPTFLPYHARVAVISIISIFEDALDRFIVRLEETGKIPSTSRRFYKTKLNWAFGTALQSTMGSEKEIKRIPFLCADVDHARRIRNLWMHNNGFLDERYATDVIEIKGQDPIIVDEYKEFLADKTKSVPFILNPDAFENSIALSHIELLHHLHHTIQRVHYGEAVPYRGYVKEGKKIEWHRYFIGV